MVLEGFDFLSNEEYSLATSLSTKSLLRSPAAGGFYGTGIEIWAGFGPVGITKKTFGPIMSNFWGRFLQVFMVMVRSEKLLKMKLFFFVHKNLKKQA